MVFGLFLLAAFCVMYLVSRHFGSPQQFVTNTRWFEKDNVRLWSPLRWGKPAGYDVVEIGNSTEAITAHCPDIYIKLHDGHVIGLHSISETEVVTHSTKITDNLSSDPQWPQGSKTAYAPGYNFTIHDGHVITMMVHMKGLANGFKPSISKHPEGSFYPLPLSHEQAVELFGNPTRVHDFLAK